MSGNAELAMDISRLRVDNAILLEALYIALPYVENAEIDDGYKKGTVTRSIKLIRDAINRAEAPK